jgi:predicted tellurium resistance membrane protein TerC
MGSLLTLLRDGIYITSLDVDNAIYTTSAIEHLPRKAQRKAIFLAILIEFLARLVLIALFSWVLSGTRPLFVLFGVEFSIDVVPRRLI